MRYDMIELRDAKVFFRYGGQRCRPAIVFLHGFVCSSHMFARLMEKLEEDYYVIALDLPGFGQSDSPDVDVFDYSYQHLAEIAEEFLIRLKLDRFYLYVADLGASIGYRIALRHPDWILGVISQGVDIYDRSIEISERKISPQGIFLSYIAGEDPRAIAPDSYMLSVHYALRPNFKKIYLALMQELKKEKEEAYPRFLRYLLDYQPKMLLAWGLYDPEASCAASGIYQKDVEDCTLCLLNGGHFPLEAHLQEIYDAVVLFCQEESAKQKYLA